MQGLANPNLKLRRAKEHLDALQREVNIFIESKAYEISRRDDLDTGEHIITIKFEVPPIWPIGAVLGDFLCCLRSSLDHLIFGLASIAKMEHRGTEFPICGEYTDTTESRIAGATRGLPEGAVSIVKLFQPYNAGSAYKMNLLWILNRLWDVDKHRHLALHSGMLRIDIPILPKELWPVEEILDDCGVMRFPAAAKPYLNLEPTPVVNVLFGDDDTKTIITLSGLVRTYELVSEKIIPRFASYFPQSERIL